ncbi:competence protein ComEA [Lentibacillus populi]|uniref:Competence protein ComEA n=3 Tax=Bacillaceae TaxID=186817 RepID=A0A9W5TUH5_9BACI|nr:competence protein ComEA [Lentibacillus populi]
MLIEVLKKGAFFIIVGLALIIFFVMNNDDHKAESPEDFTPVTDSENKKSQTKETENQLVMVDIKGEVLRPGVYEISGDARVNEVIELAGGFSKEADQTMVNLAQKVQDEMVIAIPKLGEAPSNTTAASGQADGNGKVNLNYATQEEMETLNGIGPSKAQAIIQYREENGFFQTVEDLLNVSGIGEKTVENLRDDIQVP